VENGKNRAGTGKVSVLKGIPFRAHNDPSDTGKQMIPEAGILLNCPDQQRVFSQEN
jgi:hypothetical protein